MVKPRYDTQVLSSQ
ncbi:MAG: hypothetical protein AB8U62_06310 [Rickettsia aeschlimannii]